MDKGGRIKEGIHVSEEKRREEIMGREEQKKRKDEGMYMYSTCIHCYIHVYM